jgi:hypothetical protein
MKTRGINKNLVILFLEKPFRIATSTNEKLLQLLQSYFSYS